MKSLSAVAAILPVAVPVLAQAATVSYEIDPAHSSAGFAVKHLMIATVRGQFRTVSGTIEYDAQDVTRSKVQATIDAASIDTREAKRDEHLRSADFLDVAKFPSLTFTSTKVRRSGPAALQVTGNLTMHGVTREVVLDVQGPSAEMIDPWGNVKAALTATTKVDRRDFGLSWNAALEAGGVLVGEEVAVTLELELNRAAAKTAAR